MHFTNTIKTGFFKVLKLQLTVLFYCHNRIKVDIFAQFVHISYLGLDACLRGFVNNTGADQPAHLRSLISPFVFAFRRVLYVNLLQVKKIQVSS